MKIKVGLAREEKKPFDLRVAITPAQASMIKKEYPDVDILCQSSGYRCYSDEEYHRYGIKVVDTLQDCDIIIGIKEFPVQSLLEGKTYFFFSHTIKKQPHNQKMFKAIIDKKIKLIDFECLKDERGKRVIAFGRFAGIVGAYNTFLAYGLSHRLYYLRRAYMCFEYREVKEEFNKVKLPPVKIVVTGDGRVGKGVDEFLSDLHIKKVNPSEFLFKKFEFPVYTQLSCGDYNLRKSDDGFDLDEYYTHPSRYRSDFYKYARVSDIFISTSFWHPEAPAYFTIQEMQSKEFSIRLIGDISCDINGPIPSTIRNTSIPDPFYDFDPESLQEKPAFSSPDFISVMAIDNLPSELPRDASEYFGIELMDKVLPILFSGKEHPMITGATITSGGKLKPPYEYLLEYSKGV